MDFSSLYYSHWSQFITFTGRFMHAAVVKSRTILYSIVDVSGSVQPRLLPSLLLSQADVDHISGATSRSRAVMYGLYDPTLSPTVSISWTLPEVECGMLHVDAFHFS